MPLLAQAYAAVAKDGGRNEATLRYQPSVPLAASVPQGDAARPPGRRSRRPSSPSSTAAAAEEVQRGITLVGPHRDELALAVGTLPVKGYASHGESWSYALAMRLASYDLLRADGDDPILILDDVFAELDTDRRERLAELVAGAEQVLVTAAVEADVPAVLPGARVEVRREERAVTGPTTTRRRRPATASPAPGPQDGRARGERPRAGPQHRPLPGPGRPRRRRRPAAARRAPTPRLRGAPRRPGPPDARRDHRPARSPSRAGAPTSGCTGSSPAGTRSSAGTSPSTSGRSSFVQDDGEDRTGGRLVVQTDSTAWATQMRLLAPTVVRRLNEELGDGTVRVIDVQGPTVPSWKTGPAVGPRRPGPPGHLRLTAVSRETSRRHSGLRDAPEPPEAPVPGMGTHDAPVRACESPWEAENRGFSPGSRPIAGPATSVSGPVRG